MAQRVTGFQIWFHCDYRREYLVVDYKPLAVDEQGAETRLKAYNAQVNVSLATLTEDMQGKIARLGDYVRAVLDVPEVEIGGVTMRGRPLLEYVQVVNDPRAENQQVTAVYLATAQTQNTTSLNVASRLTEGALRLIETMRTTCEQIAWDNLRKRLGGEASPLPDTRKRVLISYKSGPAERQQFVEAIAHRLGREQFVPWYDKWEIKAGDSIARELGEGFRDVAAILIVLTPDYPGERWAREELERAITKRVEEKIRVIPVIYETTGVPELLGNLRYVDCTDHEETQIERQFRDVIDALNEVELNPYRR